MKRLFFAIVFLFFTPLASQAAVADGFIQPLGAWKVVTPHGYLQGNGTYHMGVDTGFELGTGADVYAVANGVVKEARVRSSFGLVVLVEHTLSNGKKIVSLYGHLDPADVPVTPGQTVTIGQRLGSLGTSDVNGGWPPHIHYGIHKSEYTGAWVYYGHVRDQATTDEWYDPEKYVPKHAAKDVWGPKLKIDIQDEDFIGTEILSFKAYATDLGSGVKSIEVKTSEDSKKTWQALSSSMDSVSYPYSVYKSLSGINDGPIYVKVIVRDKVGNKTSQTLRLFKKEGAYTTRHFAAMKGQSSNGFVKVMYQSGGKDLGFRPYNKKWQGSGDIAVGDVTGNGVNNVVTVKGRGDRTLVKVMTRKGTVLNKFKAFKYEVQNGARVATGDIDGDGKDEIIIGSGPGKTSQIKVFNRKGVLQWRTTVFNKPHLGGVDVAAGDLDGDGNDEVVVGVRSRGKAKIAIFDELGVREKVFRAFDKDYRGGVNVAVGNVDGTGNPEIIVGSGGDRKGQVLVYSSNGKKQDIQYTPFGKAFQGPVDVATVDWEDDGKFEILMSQAGAGEAWVKTYRYGKKKRVLVEGRVFDEGFEGGARIANW